jgi:hypothetical protein
MFSPPLSFLETLRHSITVVRLAIASSGFRYDLGSHGSGKVGAKCMNVIPKWELRHLSPHTLAWLRRTQSRRGNLYAVDQLKGQTPVNQHNSQRSEELRDRDLAVAVLPVVTRGQRRWGFTLYYPERFNSYLSRFRRSLPTCSPCTSDHRVAGM